MKGWLRADRRRCLARDETDRQGRMKWLPRKSERHRRRFPAAQCSRDENAEWALLPPCVVSFEFSRGKPPLRIRVGERTPPVEQASLVFPSPPNPLPGWPPLRMALDHQIDMAGKTNTLAHTNMPTYLDR